MAERLDEARARTLLLVAPLSDEDLPRPARSADEPHPLGPGAHRAFRGAVAHPQPRRADRVRRDARAVQSVRASAQRPRRAAAAGLRALPRDHGRDPRPGAGPDRGRPTRRRPIRCCATATSTAWCCSTSTSTTRPSSRRCSSSRARPTRRRPGSTCRGPRLDGAARARWCASPAARSRSAPTTGRRPTTTSVRATGWSCAPFCIDVDPVTNGEYLGFIAAGGYRRPEYWSEAGRRWLAESGADAPKYWSP